MPLYSYICPDCGLRFERLHALRGSNEIVIVCPACFAPGRRRPQNHSVNWGGLRPSQGEYSPEIKQWLDSFPRRRETYLAHHEEHERITANE